MGKAGQTGVNKNTPDKIMFGAGTIHRNLKEDLSNLEESIVGATKEGSGVTITPNFYTIAADGALVGVKGLTRKVGEKAVMKVKFLEVDPQTWKNSLIAQFGDSEVEGYALLESKSDVEDEDYLDNIAFVGKTLADYDIIVILPNALCTTGLNIESKNAEEWAGEHEFVCHAGLEDDLTKLPYKIYTNDPAFVELASK